MSKRLYEYNGPIMLFNRCIANYWHGATVAVTEAKAKSNMAHQYKRENNLEPTAKITLPGNVEVN